MNLSELTKKRREHIKSCRDNNDNSHEIIAGLYSDRSHFIYELLQNADDAGASEVIFTLTSNSLEVRHNGTRLFNFKDVESITTVGSSTKKDDINSIGTFGAGFKSVFAITKTPIIHSGTYHFKIVDFIVPEIIEPLAIAEQKTIIYLPFNHPELSSEDAYSQISKRLQDLESESLLFLRNIQEIQWSTESDKGHYLCEIRGEQACLIFQVNEQERLKQYLIFKKYIEIDNAKLNIVVAYKLGADDSNTILPANNSKLFVFFPTEVTTGLKFLVHAPYKTTPNRETIPFYDPQNQIITDELSTLIAESILLIKEKGLLNVAFLNLLPINSNATLSLYRSAFKKVKETLDTNSLLPTFNGKYTNTKNALLAREKELTSLLDDSDCSELFKREVWLTTEITISNTNTTELWFYLRDVLNIPEIKMSYFCSQITEAFMRYKSDEWLVKFYSSITDNESLYRRPNSVLRKRPIIRLEDDSHICPENASGDLQVYLPSEGESKFKTVKKAILESEEAINFLENLGLEKPDSIAEINEFIIPKYESGNAGHEYDEYINDFRRVLAIWLESDEYKRRKVVDLLKQLPFIRSINPNRTISYQTPDNVYFRTENLSNWYENNPDSTIYFIELGIGLTTYSRDFLERLGVRYDLKMNGTNEIKIHRHSWHEESVNGFNPNFEIDGLDFALENMNLRRSVFLWSILLKHTNKLKGYIKTRTNNSHPYEMGEEKISKVMDTLNGWLWLYGKDEKLIRLSIEQIALDELNDDYQKDDDNTEKLIQILGLKLDEIIEFENKTGKKVISLEDYELLQRIKDENNDTEESEEHEDSWIPEIDPDDATIVEDKSDFQEKVPEDLSEQDKKGNDWSHSPSDNDTEERRKSDSNSNGTKDSKEIGNWGESIANRYLRRKYLEKEVVCLNETGKIGKGYDFVIRENGKDIAYYEVKSKTEETPQLFLISGTQWSWAKKLHDSGRGDMYKILVVSNAGKKEPRIREISDPVALWKAGKLFANPINIEL